MKNYNKKGLGLMGAIFILTILSILSISFFQITHHTTISTQLDIDKLRLYWAAESASNYNVNAWVSLEDSVRMKWPASYTPSSNGVEIPDYSGIPLDESIFPGAEGLTSDGILYLHSSWRYKGNPTDNSELKALEGFELYLTRYKGERKDHPGEAVWVLESTAYNPVTKNATKITMSNVYNVNIQIELAWLQNSEAIVNTLAGSGEVGNKGFFGDNDYRYGKCYFSDVIQLNYGGMGQEYGPKFYGSVESTSSTISGWDASLFKEFTDSSIDKYHGITGMNPQWGNEDEALLSINNSFMGGYVQNAPSLDAEGLLWTWEDIEKHSGQEAGFGIYNIETELGDIIDKTDLIEIIVETVGPNYDDEYETYAKISQNGNLIETLPIDDNAGAWGMIAVPDGYASVSIEGVSYHDFALATETSTIEIAGSFYLQEMSDTMNELESVWFDVVDPSVEMLEYLYNQMAEIHPKGHLGLLSSLGNKAGGDINEQSFLIIPEELIFMTAAMISWNGSVEALKATSTNTDLQFFNIGSSITLSNQAAEAPAGSDKWNYSLIEDERFSHENETIFTGMGTSPSFLDHEVFRGLNPRYNWFKTNYGSIDSEEEIYGILPGTSNY
ncbi:MAG: hypothetical protein PF638_14515 [Candidatus Delongbacteria bacterium]|jgi:hypothetical protein|nr:hypothetical protein [Candidatus Delongbacteria bacterium]